MRRKSTRSVVILNTILGMVVVGIVVYAGQYRRQIREKVWGELKPAPSPSVSVPLPSPSLEAEPLAVPSNSS